MRHRTRRRWDVVWLGLGAAIAGGTAAGAALASDTERIGAYWTQATLAPEGEASIVEVIDYDFGPRFRRGIFRDVPGLSVDAPVVVSSDSAPDDLLVEARFSDTRIRIGDPDKTIFGRHRYRIEYPLDTLLFPDNTVSWNGTGTDWLVPIENVEIHLVDSFELGSVMCSKGRVGVDGGCEAREIEPGHLVVEVDGLDVGEGVTVTATRGAPLAVAPTPAEPPRGAPDDPGTGPLLPAAVALLGVALPAAVTSRVIRVKGREEVWAGGAADAAFGPPDAATASVVLLDQEELAQMSSIEFEAPRGLSAVAGGIILQEGVRTHHQVAWLIECAIRDEIQLVTPPDGDTKNLELVRGAAAPHPSVAPILDMMFDGRSHLSLGKYDETFAQGWSSLGEELNEWQRNTSLWSPEGHRRRAGARLMGSLATLAGLGLVVLGGLVANRQGVPWLAVVLVGSVLAGVGFAAVIRSWELTVRSPEGSARWLQIESFRRFIADSEASHAEVAARMGLLRQYTAWAVALDELDHWQKAVNAAAIDPSMGASIGATDLLFVSMTPSFASATQSTSTAPSSSSSGGGGGSVGGGGGGGGGGSW